MNGPPRWVLRLLAVFRVGFPEAVDRGREVIDRDDREREANRRAYARDLTAQLDLARPNWLEAQILPTRKDRS